MRRWDPIVILVATLVYLNVLVYTRPHFGHL